MLKTAKRITVLQVVNPGEIIGYLDEKAAKQLGLQQWNQTKGTIYILDSKTFIYIFFTFNSFLPVLARNRRFTVHVALPKWLNPFLQCRQQGLRVY